MEHKKLFLLFVELKLFMPSSGVAAMKRDGVRWKMDFNFTQTTTNEARMGDRKMSMCVEGMKH